MHIDELRIRTFWESLKYSLLYYLYMGDTLCRCLVCCCLGLDSIKTCLIFDWAISGASYPYVRSVDCGVWDPLVWKKSRCFCAHPDDLGEWVGFVYLGYWVRMDKLCIWLRATELPLHVFFRTQLLQPGMYYTIQELLEHKTMTNQTHQNFQHGTTPPFSWTYYIKWCVINIHQLWVQSINSCCHPGETFGPFGSPRGGENRCVLIGWVVGGMEDLGRLGGWHAFRFCTPIVFLV